MWRPVSKSSLWHVDFELGALAGSKWSGPCSTLIWPIGSTCELPRGFEGRIGSPNKTQFMTLTALVIVPFFHEEVSTLCCR